MTPAFPTIVLFDMDGTTVRHLHPWVLGVLERLDDFVYNSGKLGSKLLRRTIDTKPLVGRRRDGKRQKLLVQRAIHRFRRREVDQIVEPCPGIYAVLDLLQRQGARMGIISNGLGKGYGHDILQRFSLERYYEVAVFREDIAKPKPAPDGILRALSEINPGPDDLIWYFGDRTKDITAALAARTSVPCPIEVFAYGINAALEALKRNLGTDHIIMAWPDLEARLQKMIS